MTALIQEATAPRKPTGGWAALWHRMKEHRWHYFLLAPMVILAIMFTIWPIIASWMYSLYDWDGYQPLTDYIGIDNFREAIESPEFWQAFRQTFAFTAVGVFIQMPLALGLAILFNQLWLSGRNVYRILIFIPVVTTTAVVGVVFGALLTPQGGPINTFLLDIGLIDSEINFLGDESLALPTVLLVDLWKGIGITMIYFLAALQTIPGELYDAAKVDGSPPWKTFRHITLPLLAPFTVIITLLTVISSFNAFDIVQTMTAGGPGRATDIIPTYIYRYAFNPDESLPRYGFASAAALFFGLAVFVITIILMIPVRRARRLQHDGGRRRA